MSIVAALFFGLFVIAQGAAVFGTAWLGLRVMKSSRRLNKMIAMSISWTAWIAFTISGYTMLGGEGGFMDGFGLVILLCFTAAVSSFVFLLIWMRPSLSREQPS